MKQYFFYLESLNDAGKLNDFAKVHAFNFALLVNLPLTALEKNWLVDAKRFVAGEIDLDMLTKVRVAAWQSLGKNDCDFKDPKINQARAVICTLYPHDFADNENDMPIIRLEAIGEFYLNAGGSEQFGIALLQDVFNH